MAILFHNLPWNGPIVFDIEFDPCILFWFFGFQIIMEIYEWICQIDSKFLSFIILILNIPDYNL